MTSNVRKCQMPRNFLMPNWNKYNVMSKLYGKLFQNPFCLFMFYFTIWGLLHWLTENSYCFEFITN